MAARADELRSHHFAASIVTLETYVRKMNARTYSSAAVGDVQCIYNDIWMRQTLPTSSEMGP